MRQENESEINRVLSIEGLYSVEPTEPHFLA